jgi:hypothetical protein
MMFDLSDDAGISPNLIWTTWAHCRGQVDSQQANMDKDGWSESRIHIDKRRLNHRANFFGIDLRLYLRLSFEGQHVSCPSSCSCHKNDSVD